MPFCPECALEYTDDVAVCPECHSRLVPRLSRTAGSAAVVPDDSWISVCQVADGADADAIQGLLDSGNIPSMITSAAFDRPDKKDANNKSADEQLLSADVDIVMVPREFRQEARVLLETMLGEDFEDAGAQL